MEKYQWNNIKNPKITFPIVADDLGSIAKLYGMLMPLASATRTVRTVFFIDPDGVIRAMLLYPLTTGRNMKEIMRLLLALQAYDKTGYATPADWMPGDPQVMPVPQTLPTATQRLADQEKGAYYCLDWYLCFSKGAQPNIVQPKEQQAQLKDNAVKISPVPAENIQSLHNMADIMDMMGAPLLATPHAVTQPMAAKPATAKKQAEAEHVSAHGLGSGIMDQNRLLFDIDKNPGMNNEYRITRDYPNNGI